MTTECYGTFLYIHFNANEVSGGPVSVPLPNGYSYEQIIIHNLINITALLPYQSVKSGDRIIFPPVNCKSPSILSLFISDTSKPAEITLSIEKFGQIPDTQYFKRVFTPILVTGEDGNEYSVIPSDQFK